MEKPIASFITHLRKFGHIADDQAKTIAMYCSLDLIPSGEFYLQKGMVSHRNGFIAAGSILFLLAQILLPPGTSDAAKRIANIRENPVLWNLGHTLILVSVPFLMLGFTRLREIVRLLRPAQATLGLLLLFIGLSSEVAIAGLQIAAEGIVRTSTDEVSLSVLTAGFGTAAVKMSLFLPFLLIAPGAILLALPLFRTSNRHMLAYAGVLFGLLMFFSGIIQLKVGFIAAGVFAGFLFWQLPSSQLEHGPGNKGD